MPDTPTLFAIVALGVAVWYHNRRADGIVSPSSASAPSPAAKVDARSAVIAELDATVAAQERDAALERYHAAATELLARAKAQAAPKSP